MIISLAGTQPARRRRVAAAVEGTARAEIGESLKRLFCNYLADHLRLSRANDISLIDEISLYNH